MEIRRAKLRDAYSIENIFSSTVRKINRKDYNQKQIEVWASFAESNCWKTIISSQKVWVAEIKNELVGFCSLTANGVFNFLYVHHNYQRQGIASALQEVLESEAVDENHHTVYAKVSITARPFFQRKGYKVKKIEHHEIKGVFFSRAIMEKELF